MVHVVEPHLSPLLLRKRRFAAYWLQALILAMTAAAIALLPCWPWSSEFGFGPSGFSELIDVTLLAGLVGRS